MDYNSMRSFTITLAHRAVEDIRRGGFRQLRNYVDLCATLARKPSMRIFFDYAQKALERTDSCYYSLIQRLLDSVDEERLCTFGVNLGFSGLIYGAGQQKQRAEQEGGQVSWLMAGRCGDAALQTRVPEEMQEKRFVWVLDATGGDPAAAVPLAKANPNCAFGVLAEPASLTPETITTLAFCDNLAVMPLLQSPELTGELCSALHLMRRRKMLYILTVLLDDEGASVALSTDWLECIAQETLFCLYAHRPELTASAAKKLYRGVVDSRLETGNPVLLLDWDMDISAIDQSIWKDTCIGSALPEGAGFPLQIH